MSFFLHPECQNTPHFGAVDQLGNDVDGRQVQSVNIGLCVPFCFQAQMHVSVRVYPSALLSVVVEGLSWLMKSPHVASSLCTGFHCRVCTVLERMTISTGSGEGTDVLYFSLELEEAMNNVSLSLMLFCRLHAPHISLPSCGGVVFFFWLLGFFFFIHPPTRFFPLSHTLLPISATCTRLCCVTT